jgi:hypothetical protein
MGEYHYGDTHINSHRTAEIENYVIEISYVDFRKVKYDTRGY